MKRKILCVGFTGLLAHASALQALTEGVVIYPYYTAKDTFSPRVVQEETFVLDFVPMVPWEELRPSDDMAVDNGPTLHGKGRKQRNRGFNHDVKKFSHHERSRPVPNRRRLMQQFGHL